MGAEFCYEFSFDNDSVEYTYTKDENQNLMFEEIKINGRLFLIIIILIKLEIWII